MNKLSFQEIQAYLEKMSTLDYIHPDDIPSIELYMDQVTTFMDSKLQNNKRFDDDKVMTKTMINNYSKNDLLPPSNKKKYSKEHLILLIYIYYMKNYLTIGDIQQLLNPMTETYFEKNADHTISSIYEDIFHLEQTYGVTLRDNIKDIYELADKQYGENDDYLKTFSLIAMLSYDICVKKQLVENLIDSVCPRPISKAEAKEQAKQKERVQKEREQKEKKSK